MSHSVVHVTGARPNFPKAAPVVAALGSLGVGQRLVHTGQHYDDRMSEVFFRQLGLPAPDVNLGVGSGSHASQTAAIMTALEAVLEEDRPDLVVVYGDVNSTLAAALVCAKLTIPLAHVESGLRSFDRAMPEEVNRLVTDRLSDLLFVTSPDAIAHLAHEGIPADHIHFVGNPMIDTLLRMMAETEDAPGLPGLPSTYGVATLHRPSNVDDPRQLASVKESVHAVAEMVPLVMPVHPRGRSAMEEAGFFDHPAVLTTEPLGYVEFLGLLRRARLVVTDSGGVQEETTVLGVPCLTLRPNTERPITITHGTNVLTNPDRLAVDAANALATSDGSGVVPPLWDGRAGERVAHIIAHFLDSRAKAAG